MVEHSASPEVMGRPMTADRVRIPLTNQAPVRPLVLLLALYRTPTHDHRSTDLVLRLMEWGAPPIGHLAIGHLAIVDLASDAAVSRSGRGPH